MRVKGDPEFVHPDGECGVNMCGVCADRYKATNKIPVCGLCGATPSVCGTTDDFWCRGRQVKKLQAELARAMALADQWRSAAKMWRDLANDLSDRGCGTEGCGDPDCPA